MKIAFVMDSLDSMKLHKDTSYALMRAAFSLGWEVHHLLLNDLSLVGDRVFARSRVLTSCKEGEVPETTESASVCLNELNAIWIRKDPPFDRRYFYATLMLDFLDSSVFVINKSASLRDFNEKLAALRFFQFAPKTLISSQAQEIREFINDFERAVLKPLDGFGGKNIQFTHANDSELERKIEIATHRGSRWSVVNEFVKDASRGDKRILLVEGEPIGCILRKSSSGELHNLDQGGQALPDQLTNRDLEVCRQLKPWLIENKLFFVGIDMLGDSLTEINVTSPTGLQELSLFDKVDYPTKIIESVAFICNATEHPFK